MAVAKRIAIASLLAATAFAAPDDAWADEEPLLPAASSSPEPPPHEEEDKDLPRPLYALAAGAITSTVSMGGGAVVISRYPAHHQTRNAGMLGMQSGLTLSPLFAHMIVGETRRGIFFSLIPLTAEAGMATLMAFVPNVIMTATLFEQYAYAALITASIFGSALGVIDAVRVGERTPKKKAAAAEGINGHLVPLFGNGSAGAMISGTL